MYKLGFVYRVITFYDAASQLLLLPNLSQYCSPTTPDRNPVWPVPLSFATTEGITFVFFSFGY